jgi:hypothetical protein
MLYSTGQVLLSRICRYALLAMHIPRDRRYYEEVGAAPCATPSVAPIRNAPTPRPDARAAARPGVTPLLEHDVQRAEGEGAYGGAW